MVEVGPPGPLRNVCCGTDDGPSGGHALLCWTRDPQRLPWYKPWSWWSRSSFSRRRCAARTGRHQLYSGRCELTEHEDTIDHALERGFDTPRWSTRWTG